MHIYCMQILAQCMHHILAYSSQGLLQGGFKHFCYNFIFYLPFLQLIFLWYFSGFYNYTYFTCAKKSKGLLTTSMFTVHTHYSILYIYTYTPFHICILDPIFGLPSMTTDDVIPEKTRFFQVVIAMRFKSGLVE